MRANNYISIREHKLLLAVSFIAFVSAFASFTSNLIEAHNRSVSAKQNELREQANYVKTGKISFGLYDMSRADLRPFFRIFLVLLSLFNLLAIFKAKRFLPSAIFSIVSFLIFIFWFVGLNIAINSSEIKPTNLLSHLLHIAEPFDYITFLFVSTLFFWQITILLRMLIKTSQKENVLP